MRISDGGARAASLIVALLSGLGLACRGGFADGDACSVGQAGCACTDAGQCIEGLVCLSDLCVEPDGSEASSDATTGGEGDTGGDGDGDGDGNGDGDGDGDGDDGGELILLATTAGSLRGLDPVTGAWSELTDASWVAPRGGDLDGDRSFLWADPGAGRVVQLETGVPVTFAELTGPLDVEVAGDGSVYVALADGVERYSGSGVELESVTLAPSPGDAPMLAAGGSPEHIYYFGSTCPAAASAPSCDGPGDTRVGRIQKIAASDRTVVPYEQAENLGVPRGLVYNAGILFFATAPVADAPQTQLYNASGADGSGTSLVATLDEVVVGLELRDNGRVLVAARDGKVLQVALGGLVEQTFDGCEGDCTFTGIAYRPGG